jgi:hypothetical protein
MLQSACEPAYALEKDWINRNKLSIDRKTAVFDKAAPAVE